MAIPQPFSSTRSPQPSNPYYNCRQPFVFNGLRTLKLSCVSFPHSNRLFSIACALFDKNTGGGIPLPALHGSHVADRSPRSSSCAETQKRHFVTPLLATLPHSLSRNPFACHSYANTRDGGVSPTKFSSFPQNALRERRALTTFRINTCKTV